MNSNHVPTILRHSEPMTRRNSWNEFETVRRQMDDLFAGVIGYTPVARILNTGTDIEISPDVFETENELVFLLPVPGVEPDDIQVEATADTLLIKGERKPLYQKEGAVQHRQSWWSARQGSFTLNYNLPFEINSEAVSAHYHNGILELHLPKAESVRPRTVQVQIAGK